MRGYYTTGPSPLLPPKQRSGRRVGAERNDNDLPTHTVTTIICEMQVCQTALAVVARAAAVFSFLLNKGLAAGARTCQPKTLN